MRRAVSYLRRSTDRQDQSIEDQQQVIQRYADQNGWYLVGRYLDDAISGAFSENRSEFQRMITDAQTTPRPFDGSLTYDISRFSRGDNDEAGHYRYLLRKHGIEVVYIADDLRGDDSDDLIIGTKQWVKHQQIKDISRDTIRGMVTLTSQGWSSGRPTPYGYIRAIVSADGTRRQIPKGHVSKLATDRVTLELGDPREVAIVQRIFQTYVGGIGLRAVTNQLNAGKVPSPRGGTWVTNCIREMLMNPVYYGASVWNRRSMGKFHRVEKGRAVPKGKIRLRKVLINPESEWITKEDAFPAIVSKELWQVAQAKRRERSRTRQWNGRATSSPYLFSGLAHCGHCGHRLHGLTKVNRKGVVWPCYVCSGRTNRGASVCQAPAFAQQVLERPLLHRLEQRTKQAYSPESLRLRLHQAFHGRNGGSEAELRAIDGDLAANSRKIDRLLDFIDPRNRDLLNQKLDGLRQERDRLGQRKLELEAERGRQVDAAKLADQALAYLDRLPEVFSQGTPAERKEYLRAFLASVKVFPEKKEAQAAWYRLPRLPASVSIVAGVGFEPTTFGL